MISIIIPTVGRHQSLLRLLDSIANQDYPKESLEVLVVFNEERPKKPLPELIDESLIIRSLVAPKKGVNNARNIGISASVGDILLFIDDDCRLSDPLYLQNINHYHTRHPEITAIGGPYELSPRANFWDRAYHRNLCFWLENQGLPQPHSRFLLGGNASYKASIFNEGYRFTPGIKYGGSETPLNLKIYQDKGPLYLFKDLSLQHQTKMSFSQYINKAYRQGQGFATQTKTMSQQITLPNTTTSSGFLSQWTRYLYDFFFMVGFRASIQERKYILMPFWQESFARVKKPFSALLQNFYYVHRYIRSLYAN